MGNNKNIRCHKPWETPFFCSGCHKTHGKTIERIGYLGRMFCNRQYYKLKNLALKGVFSEAINLQGGSNGI